MKTRFFKMASKKCCAAMPCNLHIYFLTKKHVLFIFWHKNGLNFWMQRKKIASVERLKSLFLPFKSHRLDLLRQICLSCQEPRSQPSWLFNLGCHCKSGAEEARRRVPNKEVLRQRIVASYDEGDLAYVPRPAAASAGGSRRWLTGRGGLLTSDMTHCCCCSCCCSTRCQAIKSASCVKL